MNEPTPLPQEQPSDIAKAIAAIDGAKVRVAELFAQIESLVDERTAMQTELSQWRTWGIVEIAVRNPNVASYMDEWEGRATKAEAELSTLRAEREALMPALRFAWDVCSSRDGGWRKHELTALGLEHGLLVDDDGQIRDSRPVWDALRAAVSAEKEAG